MTEAHAPTNTMSAARLGMWLFLASETMFFAGIVGGFLVLQNAVGEHAVFVKSARLVTQFSAAGVLTLTPATLCVVCFFVLSRGRKSLVWASALGAGMVAAELLGCRTLLRHHTVAVVNADTGFVYDGTIESETKTDRTISGRRNDLPEGFDAHAVTSSDFLSPPQRYVFQTDSVRQDVSYGPSRNNFFAAYFLMTAVHAVHVVAGILAVGWMFVRRRGSAAMAPVVMYWQFVNLLGVASVLLYFSARL